MGIPTTGGNLWSVTSQYSWMGDDLVTDAWIADARYLDSTSSVGTVSPQKGSISLVQATGGNKPIYSAAWGTGLLGRLRYDGVDDWMSGDSLAAKVTGNPPRSFTLIQSFDLRSVVISSPWSFSDTSNSAKQMTPIPQTGITNSPWQLNWFDDAAHAATDTATVTATTTGKVVLTIAFDMSVLRASIRMNAIDQVAGHAVPGVTPGQTTLSRFTVGAFRGSSVVNACSMDWRGTIFAPSVLPAANILRHERCFLTQAA